jgi:hypothetical protein
MGFVVDKRGGGTGFCQCHSTDCSYLLVYQPCVPHGRSLTTSQQLKVFNGDSVHPFELPVSQSSGILC